MENAKNKTLYKRVVAEAKQTFDVWPSAYASMWVQKRYMNLGGDYFKKDTGLKDWVSEKWVQILPLLESGRVIECGDDNKETKACRPTVRVDKDTPITVQELLELHTIDDIIKVAKKKNKDMDGRVSWDDLKFTPS